MSEKILDIDEIQNYRPLDQKHGYYNGYSIKTSEQVIYLLISNGQSCCENWGYFMSEDTFTRFIGSALLSITTTDKALNTASLKSNDAEYLDEGGIVFVNLETDKGTLQFVAYNAHNGYYGHDVRIISKQLIYSDGV